MSCSCQVKDRDFSKPCPVCGALTPSMLAEKEQKQFEADRHAGLLASAKSASQERKR